MPSLPIVPTQVTKTGNVGSVDVFRAAHLFTFGSRGQGNELRGSWKKSAKNRGSQWYAQSAHCAHIGRVKGKCGFSGRSYRASLLFTFGPRGQGIALRGSWMVSKNPQKIGEANGVPILPTGPTQDTKTGNVGSVDVFRAAHLFTFGSRGQGNALRVSWMVSKNQQKIGEANGMPSLPIVQKLLGNLLRGTWCNSMIQI